jgi:putative phage-type endonuclease
MPLTEKQHAERANGIGGSDAAAVLGLSRWRTPLDVYLAKKKPAENRVAETEPMRWGTLLEPVVRQEFAEKTGRVITLPEGTIRHPKYPFMLAHPDGVSTDGRLYEGKTARSAEEWGESGSSQIPQEYCIQVQHYMAVMGLPVADVAVLIAGNDFRTYEIPADPEMQALIIEGEEAFWDRLEREEAPTPDFNAGGVLQLVRRLYPGTNGARVIATPDDEHWRFVMEDAAGLAKQYQAVADGGKAHLLYQMGEAAELVFQDRMALRRQLIKKEPYSVAAQKYIDARLVKVKDAKDKH